MKLLALLLALGASVSAQTKVTTTQHYAVLNWNGATNDANGNPVQYTIWRDYGNACVNPKAKYNLMGSATGMTTFKDSTGLVSGVTHCWKVCNTAGCTAPVTAVIP